uniref:Replication associated protein n=1 Tax=Phytoplasma australiense TaxID=59748 RepID=Q0QLC5_PHYAS|nr:replication-associated protein [Candidatus Phytoplasma australiense]ABD04144.1 replication associated protein [Candidatus Phytoplasma australiense]
MKKENKMKKETKTNFRLRTRDIFLTYSKCPLGKEKIHNHLKQLLASKKKEIKYIISNNENHQDHKEIHTHVFIQLKKQIEITNQRFFDIEGYHPKIETARDVEKSVSYIKKDKDFIDEGEYIQKKYVRQNQKEERKQLIYDYICEKRIEYYNDNDNSLNINKIRKEIDDFILKIDRDFYYEQIELIDRILNRRFIRKKEELADTIKLFGKSHYQFNSFKTNSETNEIIDAINSQLLSEHRPKSIVIEGESRMGKTQFILSYLTHKNLQYNYIKGEFDFSKKTYKDYYKIDVYDDFGVPEINSQGLQKNIIGGQECFTCNVKYAPKRQLSGNKLSIFLVNPDNSFKGYCEWSRNNGHKFHKYIEENCIFIYVSDKLF